MATRKQNGNGKSAARASTRATFVAAQRRAIANDERQKTKKVST